MNTDISNAKKIKMKHLSVSQHGLFGIIFLLFISFFTVGCQSTSKDSKEDFNHFLDQCLQVYATKSKMYLHTLFEDPEKYGISLKDCPSFPAYDEKSIENELEQKKQLKEILSHFHKEDLSEEQQLLALILENDLALSIKMEQDYAYYKSTLGSDGTAISTIRTLCEYRFENEEDVKNYLSLLDDLPDYLSEIYDYEMKRSQIGLSPSRLLLRDTINSMEHFLDIEFDQCALITTFDARIKKMPSVTQEQMDNYIAKNKAKILDDILPACQDYVDKLSSIPEEQQTDQERIVQFDGGSEYYQLLLNQATGTDLTPDQCKEALLELYEECQTDFNTLIKNHADLFTEYYSVTPDITEPAEILDLLRKEALVDFPPISKKDYAISSLPDALSNYQNVASYVIPALDESSEQRIEVTDWMIDPANLYGTLAHEGFPGHMYQTSYMYENLIHPIQACLRNKGFDEGWGSYAQMYGYSLMTWSNLDEDKTASLQSLYKDNALMSLCLCGLSDLYVNDENHTMTELTEWLADYGISENNAKSIYHYVIGHPSEYLSYSVGYYEIINRKEKAEQEEHFSLSDFHKDILSYGSCPFSIVFSFNK